MMALLPLRQQPLTLMIGNQAVGPSLQESERYQYLLQRAVQLNIVLMEARQPNSLLQTLPPLRLNRVQRLDCWLVR